MITQMRDRWRQIPTVIRQMGWTLPAWLLVVAIAYYAIPRIDPRSGIGGWGVVWDVAILGFSAAVASFIAGSIHRAEFRHLNDKEEWALLGSSDWRSFAAVALDRATFLFLFLVIFWAFSGQ